MSILTNDINVGLELRFNETFNLTEIKGASECNESIAVAKFYNLTEFNPRHIKNSVEGCLSQKLHQLTGMEWAMSFINTDKWIDICRAIIRIRPGKTRIAICKRNNINTYGFDRGPAIYIRVERQGMRKKNHWYSTFEFKVTLKEENLGPYIFKNLDVSDSYWTFINIDRDGNLVRTN